MNKPSRETLVLVSEALFKAAVVIEVRAADVKKWPDDVEALHQYRISIRVARSLAKFLAPYQAKAENRRLKVALKTLQDPTSRMREADVLVKKLGAIEQAQGLIGACVESQAQIRAAFMEGFVADVTQSLIAEVVDIMKHPTWRASVRKHGIEREALVARVQEQRDACEAVLATSDFMDLDKVHDLRKDAKRLRYVSRELSSCLPEGADAISGRMKEVQDLLGDWCDANVNAALVREVCGDAGEEVALLFQSQAEAIVEGLRAGA